MATIRERVDAAGKKTYHVQIRIQGFPPQTKSFSSKAIAKQWAAHVESELRAGRYLPRIEAQRHTVRELLEKYRDEILAHYPAKRIRDEGAQVAWWIGKLGQYSLADLSPALIGQARDELSATPIGKSKPRAPATVVRYLATLSTILSVAAKEWQWIQESPMSKVTKPRVRNERVRYLTADECARLLDAAQQSANAYLYVVVVMALSTGMRYSEIMHLRWRDVTWTALATYALVVLETTKNGERRGVPLTGMAFAAFKEFRNKRADMHERFVKADALLFPSDSKPDRPIEIRKAWETSLSRAQVENFRFHDLRHTAASYLAMGGATAPEIAEVLGHKDLKMVKRYAHFGKDHIAEMMTRMSDARFPLESTAGPAASIDQNGPKESPDSK
jgi:integrase